jgi:hypothetical protein
MTKQNEEVYVITPLGIVRDLPSGELVLNALELHARRMAGEKGVGAIIFDRFHGSFDTVVIKPPKPKGGK